MREVEEMEVDGIVSVRTDSHTSTTPMLQIKEDGTGMYADSDAMNAESYTFNFYKNYFVRDPDLEWNPDLTF